MTETSDTARTTMSRIQALADGAYDVVIGRAKAPGSSGYYVALEHLELREPEEFRRVSIGDSVLAASVWAAARAFQQSHGG